MDTGPLVALLDRREQYHDWVVTQVENLQPPFHTCEAVISEACFLLQHLPTGIRALTEMLNRKSLIIPFRLTDELPAVTKLLLRYPNLRISLADACLIRMSEQRGECVVLTLDRDFRVYRRHGRQVIPTLLPEE
jgi:predicted nucleic acid-binding protein